MKENHFISCAYVERVKKDILRKGDFIESKAC